MSKTAISASMATYNGERFLQERQGSLVRQTLLPFELVVTDDGSADGTLESSLSRKRRRGFCVFGTFGLSLRQMLSPRFLPSRRPA
jgi:glycosyltransferase involved in cell wall biosynthesis